MSNQPISSHSIPRTGDRLWVVGDIYTFKATGAETGGAYTAIEMNVSPNCGPPLHRHTREDEAFYILEGELEFLVDGRKRVVSAGEFVHAPRNSVHRFANCTDARARMLVMTVPAGIEEFFGEIGDPVTDPAQAPPLDVARIVAAAPRYGLEILL